MQKQKLENLACFKSARHQKTPPHTHTTSPTQSRHNLFSVIGYDRQDKSCARRDIDDGRACALRDRDWCWPRCPSCSLLTRAARSATALLDRRESSWRVETFSKAQTCAASLHAGTSERT